MGEQYDAICSFESLYQAHKKARLGKQHKNEVIRFELHLTENLEKLSYHLQNHTYKIRGYRKFVIHDPKTREIQALCYGDRVVQHSLCDNALGPYLDRRLIYDNAACREGKGTHFAMDRLSMFLRDFYKKHGMEGYILKCDIKKYFPSISHTVLHKLIGQMKLEAEIRGLLHLIVDSYHEEEDTGIPMGNQTSQWFALYYLDGVDRLIKEELKIRYYTRYMDDMILVHENREYLKWCQARISDFLETERSLSLNRKTQIHHIRQGVDYLGFHFYLTETGKVIRKLRQSSKKRMKKKLAGFKRLYQENEIGLEEIGRSLTGMKGHLQHGHTWYLRNQTWRQFILQRNRNSNEAGG